MAVSITASRCPQNHPCPAIRVCPSGCVDATRLFGPRRRSEEMHRLRPLHAVLRHGGNPVEAPQV